ncbi:unnamed protein product [Ilex paraguariensis]|uniref:DUF7731 domain-containing protein n=1 Tax=Ilex paraguariensis TaxID=185542 RepID=A0ABC8UMZ4_9AQUA
MYGTQISHSCPIKYVLTEEGWLNVTHGDGEEFCKAGCADHTRTVLTCIHLVKRDYWFANKATVKELYETINRGCNTSIAHRPTLWVFELFKGHHMTGWGWPWPDQPRAKWRGMRVQWSKFIPYQWVPEEIGLHYISNVGLGFRSSLIHVILFFTSHQIKYRKWDKKMGPSFLHMLLVFPKTGVIRGCMSELNLRYDSESKGRYDYKSKGHD